MKSDFEKSLEATIKAYVHIPKPPLDVWGKHGKAIDSAINIVLGTFTGSEADQSWFRTDSRAKFVRLIEGEIKEERMKGYRTPLSIMDNIHSHLILWLLEFEEDHQKYRKESIEKHPEEEW